MTEIYYLARDGDGSITEVFHDDEAVLDFKARNSELEVDILAVVDLNDFTDYPIQTEDGAKAVIKRIENSLNSGDS